MWHNQGDVFVRVSINNSYLVVDDLERLATFLYKELNIITTFFKILTIQELGILWFKADKRRR